MVGSSHCRSSRQSWLRPNLWYPPPRAFSVPISERCARCIEIRWTFVWECRPPAISQLVFCRLLLCDASWNMQQLQVLHTFCWTVSLLQSISTGVHENPPAKKGITLPCVDRIAFLPLLLCPFFSPPPVTSFERITNDQLQTCDSRSRTHCSFQSWLTD